MTNGVTLKYIDYHFYDDSTFSNCPKGFAMIGFISKEYEKMPTVINLVSLENFYKDKNINKYEIVDFVGLIPVLDVVN